MYHELRVTDGLPHVACGWLADGEATTVLPDGCVDVVLTGGMVIVAGPIDDGPFHVNQTPGQHAAGEVPSRSGRLSSRDTRGPIAKSHCAPRGRLGRRWAARERPGRGGADRPTALATLLRAVAEPRAPLDHHARRAASWPSTNRFPRWGMSLGSASDSRAGASKMRLDTDHNGCHASCVCSGFCARASAT